MSPKTEFYPNLNSLTFPSGISKDFIQHFPKTWTRIVNIDQWNYDVLSSLVEFLCKELILCNGQNLMVP